MKHTHCPHCGGRLDPPAVPKNCVCDPNTYIDPDNIPTQCDSYVGNGYENCQTCEHDKECHKPPNA